MAATQFPFIPEAQRPLRLAGASRINGRCSQCQLTGSTGRAAVAGIFLWSWSHCGCLAHGFFLSLTLSCLHLLSITILSTLSLTLPPPLFLLWLYFFPLSLLADPLLLYPGPTSTHSFAILTRFSSLSPFLLIPFLCISSFNGY